MNNQNRKMDGSFCDKKEAQRADVQYWAAFWREDAKSALRAGDKVTAQNKINDIASLRAAFFADYAEAA